MKAVVDRVVNSCYHAVIVSCYYILLIIIQDINITKIKFMSIVSGCVISQSGVIVSEIDSLAQNLTNFRIFTIASLTAASLTKGISS